jgi:poly(3-hydroxybutyrate) depolymerase
MEGLAHNGAMRRLAWLAVSCLVFVAVSRALPGEGQGREPAPGQIAENVTCRGDATQRYAVYLPSGYSRDRAWPVLYAFDAGARGLLPVQRFKDAAERYGYIVVGSHNSRNGPIAVAHDAMSAMLADTASRFTIDRRRIYFAGFSGGARVAVLAALAIGDDAAGVIGAAAGFPAGVEPTASMPFAYYGTAGTDDFNYPEMTTLDQTLGRLGLPHRVEVFDGDHDWPPADVCVRAIEWMETEAMRSKRRVRDEALIDRIAARIAAEARADEEAGRASRAWSGYSALAATLAGFRDVALYEQKIRQLAASPAVRRALTDQAESIRLQQAAHAQLTRLAREVLSGQDRAAATAEFTEAFESLRQQSKRPVNDAERMAARRVMVSSWGNLNEAVTADMDAGRFARAIAGLELMRHMRPESAGVDYRLARAFARAGDRNAAMRALRDAVTKGIGDVAAIEAEADFESLRGDEGFRELLRTQKK